MKMEFSHMKLLCLGAQIQFSREPCVSKESAANSLLLGTDVRLIILMTIFIFNISDAMRRCWSADISHIVT